jgi:hypothetical protein
VEEAGFSSVAISGTTPQLLPSAFIDGERFYFKLADSKGDTLLGFGDTGGGHLLIPQQTIDKLGLGSLVKHALAKGVLSIKYLLYDDLIKDNTLPHPAKLSQLILRRPFARVDQPFFIVPPDDDELKAIRKAMAFDVFLGQGFFMGKAWTIDYPNRQIWVNTPLIAGTAGTQKLGFKKNSIGEKINGHPRMYIIVDGELIEVLFDTGASITLTEEGKQALNNTHNTIGGSFIAATIFDNWRKRHPEWKYYPKADMGGDLIEVPKVTIGGLEVGPALFARRPDAVWAQGMINSMDSIVRGAIGGSALKFLKVTIDYNSELIKFER